MLGPTSSRIPTFRDSTGASGGGGGGRGGAFSAAAEDIPPMGLAVVLLPGPAVELLASAGRSVCRGADEGRVGACCGGASPVTILFPTKVCTKQISLKSHTNNWFKNEQTTDTAGRRS